MSFDVFFQGFVGGESSGRGGAEMVAVLAPYFTDHDRSFHRIAIGDGDADVYLGDEGMIANHISGRDPWDLLVRGARAADWVIMPVGCPTCLTMPSQLGELPEGIGEEAVVVRSGADLLAVITST